MLKVSQMSVIPAFFLMLRHACFIQLGVRFGHLTRYGHGQRGARHGSKAKSKQRNRM